MKLKPQDPTAAEATPPLDIPVLQGTILYHSLEVLVSETWWTLVPYRPFYKLYSIPKAQKLSANIPKSLFLKELLSPNGTVTALLEQLESYLKSLRSFLSAWPGHLSSMPKRIPLFRCGNLFFYSSWGRVLPWFSPGTCLLPTP